jgi:hypothetical protein
VAWTGWGTGNHFRYASGIITTEPLSISAWVYTTASQSVANIAGLWTSGSAWNRNVFRLAVLNDAVNANTGSATGAAGAQTSTTMGTDTWHHACGVWTSATSRASYLDGGGKGTNTNSHTPTGIDRTSIGTGDGSTSTSAWNATGFIAEVAYWNAALTDAEVLVLSRGFSPLFVRPASLVAYYPLIGRSSPEVNRFDRTAVQSMQGTLTAAAHPRIIMPRRSKVPFVVPAAAGAAIGVGRTESLRLNRLRLAA